MKRAQHDHANTRALCATQAWVQTMTATGLEAPDGVPHWMIEIAKEQEHSKRTGAKLTAKER